MASTQNDLLDFLGLSTQPKNVFFVLNVLTTCHNNEPLKFQILSGAFYLLTKSQIVLSLSFRTCGPLIEPLLESINVRANFVINLFKNC